jgi:hypothetical protein
LVALLAIRNAAVPSPASADVLHHTGHIRNWTPTDDDQINKVAWDPTNNWADQITSTIVNALDDVHRHQSPPSSTAMTGGPVLKSVMK